MPLEKFKFCEFRVPYEAQAKNWFDNPIQSLPVDRIGDFSQTADGACRVSFGDRSVGFVKPKSDAGTKVVANEKIASDLARLLHLPVPPVLIREPEDGNEWDRFTALSLSCLGDGRHWGEGPKILDGRTVPMLEAMRVFWTWLGDTDHNGHPNNLIFQDEADSSISMNAIDHSYLWGQGAAADAFPASNGYGSASHALAAEARECTLEAIQSLDKDAVDQLVTRLVGRVVNNDEANGMCAWLANRIGHLPFLLGIGE